MTAGHPPPMRAPLCVAFEVGQNSGGVTRHCGSSAWCMQEQAGRHLYSSCSFCRSALNSPMISFSFFFSAAVMAVRVRSLLEPTPQPCQRARSALSADIGEPQLAMSSHWRNHCQTAPARRCMAQ